MKWTLSVVIAGIMQFSLDYVLPQATPRIIVIMAAGVTMIIWSKIDEGIYGR